MPSTTTKAGAIGACLLLATACPAATAWAQPATTTTTADAGRAGPHPPPLDPSYPLPVDHHGPDEPYAREGTVGCVASSLDNGKVVLHDIPWGQTRLRIRDAQKFTKGAGVTVAVIDTGVNRHRFLSGRLAGGGEYVDAANHAPGLEDCDGHGTEVAGIIAADTSSDPEIGFTGVAPKARIISIRQSSSLYMGASTDADGKRPAGTLGTLAQAVIDATDQDAGVINMSVDDCRSATAYPITDEERQLQAALHYAVQNDVVVVSSAGNLNERDCPGQNNGPDPDRPDTIVLPPWFSDDVISVAAMTPSGDPAEFSMHGPWVSVAAPGTRITSLDPATNRLANETYINGERHEIDGTSFAAPYVSGVAALVRARYPKLDARQVMNRIEQTAQHPAAPGGRDEVVGYGMINPVAALTQYIPAEDGVPAATASNVAPQLPPAVHRDWAPMQVALAGTGGGIGLLLMTLFVVHTIRRKRKSPTATRS